MKTLAAGSGKDMPVVAGETGGYGMAGLTVLARDEKLARAVGLDGKVTRASGSVDSVMAGLACAEASPIAWKFMRHCIDYFLTISDEDAVAAMKALAAGSGKDMPVVAGETGGSGMAGLTVLARDEKLARAVGLDGSSRVLVINTEGATAPLIYQGIVGESAESVFKRQAAWLSQSK